MYRILMPVDQSVDRAVSQATFVASLPEAADTVETIVLFVFHEEGDDLPDELKQFKSAERIESVRRAREYLEERSVTVRVLDSSGDTVTDILETAEQFDVDSIVVGGRKRSAVGKALFGSVTQSVVLETERPVVVTGG